MILMSTRLQVVMDPKQLESLHRVAQRQGQTLSEWVRATLERAANDAPEPSGELRMRALDKALSCGHPSGPIEELLADIERGRDLR
jgi:hypothetical protein